MLHQVDPKVKQFKPKDIALTTLLWRAPAAVMYLLAAVGQVWRHVVVSRGLCPAAAALVQLKLQVQRPAAAERPGGRECSLPLSRRVRGSAVVSGHVSGTRSGRAGRCRRSRAWRPG